MCDRRRTGVCPGASISAGRSAVVPGQSAGPTASRQARSTTWHLPARDPTRGMASRRNPTRHVQDRPRGTSGHPAIDAGQRCEWRPDRVVELTADVEVRVLGPSAVPAVQGFEHDSNVCPGVFSPPRSRQAADLGRWQSACPGAPFSCGTRVCQPDHALAIMRV